MTNYQYHYHHYYYYWCFLPFYVGLLDGLLGVAGTINFITSDPVGSFPNIPCVKRTSKITLW